MPRSALIVDDSRTALLALGRLLKEQGIAADMVESGPEALDYLRSNSPGVIFLDHMMPGMDGFETLAALKSNARTAAIPVVMYTSREGDAYMGQALVQGAFGILQKPVNPHELGQILKRVDQLRVPSAIPNESTRSTPNQVNHSGQTQVKPRAAVTGVIHVPPEFRRPVSEAGVQPTSKSRAPGSGREKSSTRPFSRFPFPRVMLAIVLLLPGVWYFERYQQAERVRVQMQSEIQAMQAELRVAHDSAEAREDNQQRAELDTRQRRSQKEVRAMFDAIAWALNQHGQYRLGDEPLSDARLAQLRELIARLATAGFQGTVRLETHIGEFCLVRDEQGNLRLPNDSLAINGCEVVTYPPAQAEQLSQRQSAAFARFLAERRPGNPIQITVVAYGARRPLVTYPDLASLQTAGDWNQIARLNQRVEITLLPAP